MKEEIYCIKCGTKNKKDNLLCKKCHRKLHQKEHLLIDYFVGKKEDEVGETILKTIKKFIINHLYGIIMTCSILITSVAVIYNISNRSDTSYIEKVTERPVIVKKEEPSINSEDEENEKFFSVALSYVDAIQAGNLNQASTYYIENNNPTAFRQMGGTYDVNGNISFMRSLYQYGKILFRMTAEGDYYITKTPHKVQLDSRTQYPYRVYRGYMNYCSYNSCKIVDGKQQSDFTVPFEIYVINVEENYYVYRENFAFPRQDDIYILSILEANDGDTSKINFDGLVERFKNCMDNSEHFFDHCYTETVN